MIFTVRRSAAVLNSILFALAGIAAQAQLEVVAKANAPANITPNAVNITGVKGPGATAAHAQAGGNDAGVGAAMDPLMGATFDNTQFFDAARKFPYLSKENTDKIAESLNKVYTTQDARSLQYNMQKTDDKVTPVVNGMVQQIQLFSKAGEVTSGRTTAYGEGLLTSKEAEKGQPRLSPTYTVPMRAHQHQPVDHDQLQIQP